MSTYVNHVPRSKHPWNPWITACTTALRASPSSTLGLLRSRFTPSASLPVAELEAEDNSGASWRHIVGATLWQLPHHSLSAKVSAGEHV